MMASGRSLPSYGAVQEYRDDPNYKDYSDKPGFEEQLSAITRNISAINNGEGDTLDHHIPIDEDKKY
ncbi:hypothetical protein DPMN_006299 [Dreissena polymorpha]|uniref:Uncharacterized protein n=1 Tax=Dreissena polymorpha TaxID=45954 RepID=A0A9D4MRP8_DREPO|nr:hypothetical protein DPMN_006299 [Dreissena polymorpha]